MTKKSRNAWSQKTLIRKGLAIYKTGASPYYFARILDSRTGKYKVRSTKETSRLEARKVAEELAAEITSANAPAPKAYSFRTYAQRFVAKAKLQAERGERNANYTRTATSFLENSDYGLVPHFGDRDVREVTTRDWQLFIEKLAKDRPDLSPSTRNSIMAAFRNVMKGARDDGIIDSVPATPRTKQKDNPRSYFQFAPLCSKEADEWEKLKRAAKEVAAEGMKVRGVEITGELYDLMLFCLHTFVRPTTSELFALKHSDIAINQNPERLTIRIRRGKTGARSVESMKAAVPPYKRLRQRYPDAKGEDYIFMPDYPKRATAARNFARQFNYVLDRSGLKIDAGTGSERSLYSLRHTAICMRLVLSGGEVNIYSLAKNAGTSVEQIERFYARRLPLSGKMLENLQRYVATKR
jgi:hypothetical protein